MKTILGFHNKQNEKYEKLDPINVPLIVGEEYEPFLITSSQFFTVQTPQIITQLKALPIRKVIGSIKSIIAYILLLPGLFTSFLYLSDFFTAVVKEESQSIINIPAWIQNLVFWLAAWSLMFLWHETYRQKKQESKVNPPKEISNQQLIRLKKGDLQLSQLDYTDCLEVTTEETLVMIEKAIKNDKLDSLILFKNLSQNPVCKAILERVELQILSDQTKLEELKITAKTMPEYPISSIRSLLVYAAEESVLTYSDTVEPQHLFITLFKIFPILKYQLQKNQVNIDLLRKVAEWVEQKQVKSESTNILNPEIPYAKSGGIASNWIYGYTFILDHYSKDLTREISRDQQTYGIGHESEVEELISVLSKVSQNDALLIGESGTGKTSIVKGLAQKISQGSVPHSLQNMRVVQLDINSLIAAGPQYGNLESLVASTMEELQKAENTILFIDEIQEIATTRGEESKHTLAGILLPYILDSKFPIVGTINFIDYKKYFQARASLKDNFHLVQIDPVSPDASFDILLTKLEEWEVQYKIEISFTAIKTAIELAQRYEHQKRLPNSAVGFMEAACSAMANTGEKVLTPEFVADVVSNQKDIPANEISLDEAQNLLKLKDHLKAKVIGQDEAIEATVEALKRSRAGVRDQNKPIGAFLFLGPTGVGKTYLAQTLSSEYFGVNHQIIRLDMSEYKEKSSIRRLLGSDNASENTAASLTFLDQVKRNPFSVILLDEIEKAHPEIMDLFLQVFDEGRLTNSDGETINFSNCIIISTSNIGSKEILKSLEENVDIESIKDEVESILKENIRVELINRFDKVIVFNPLTDIDLQRITKLLLEELRERLQEKEIKLKWDDEVTKTIAQKSKEPGMGARPIRRYIQDNVEGAIATKILYKELNPGDIYNLDKKMFD